MILIDAAAATHEMIYCNELPCPGSKIARGPSSDPYRGFYNSPVIAQQMCAKPAWKASSTSWHVIKVLNCLEPDTFP